jgi:uncharacterized membrane protein
MVIAEIGPPARVTDRLCAHVWLGEDPLTPRKPYLLKLATCMVTAIPEPVLRVIDLDTRESVPADRLATNEIDTGIRDLDRSIAVDLYADNKETGSFILIDPESYDTVGLGTIDGVPQNERHRSARRAMVELLRSTESHARSIAEAASWRVTGSIDTFIIAAFITGSPRVGGAVALTEIATKTALYYLHERAWILIPWRKRSASQRSSVPTPRMNAAADSSGLRTQEAVMVAGKSLFEVGVQRPDETQIQSGMASWSSPQASAESPPPEIAFDLADWADLKVSLKPSGSLN